MASIALFITHTAKDGNRDALRTVWMRHMVPAIEANPDHMTYVYSFDTDDPNVVCAFQVYSSAEAAQAFLKHPSYLAYLEESRPLLSNEPQIRILDPQWMKTA